jgi:hypothetical protein
MRTKIKNFAEKANEMKPQFNRQDLEERIFEGLLTESLLSGISAVMTEMGIPYRFGLYQNLGEDFTGFVPREGAVYIHATHYGNYGKNPPVITWGIVERGWLKPSSND